MKKMVALLALCAAAYAGFKAPDGPRDGRAFDPARLAALEAEMWEADDAKERLRPFRLLVLMQREQYNYPWSSAIRGSVYLTSANASLSGSRGNYYEAVLPDLVAAHQMARDWSGASYDPGQVARAELTWLAAQRDPDKNSLKNVARLIADEYALLYETSPSTVFRAAQLRAQATAMREADEPDWDEIGRVLEESYTQLLAAVAPRS